MTVALHRMPLILAGPTTVTGLRCASDLGPQATRKNSETDNPGSSGRRTRWAAAGSLQDVAVVQRHALAGGEVSRFERHVDVLLRGKKERHGRENVADRYRL